MSNRNYIQFQYSLEKKWVSLFATLNFGATGAVTLQQWQAGTFGGAAAYAAAATSGFKGIAKVVLTSTSTYTFTLQDRFVRLLSASVTMIGTSATAVAAPGWQVVSTGTNLSPAVITTAPTIQVVYYNTSGSATAPGSGEQHLWQFDLADSSAP